MKPQTRENAEARVASAPTHYRSMINHADARFAVVRGGRTVKEVLAYLPGNYQLMESFEVEERPGKTALWVVIGGYDNAGWTLDNYVIPRLASGLMSAEPVS